MQENFDIEDGKYGRRLVLKSFWKDEYFRLFAENNIVELELNDGKGWKGEHLNFLADIKGLISLIIIDFSIKSIQPIHWLRNLKKLEISTLCKTPIDFSCFQNLVDCGLEWRGKSDSLFDIASLQSLHINKFKGNSDLFLRLKKLENLSLMNIKDFDLPTLYNLTNLKCLRVVNFKNQIIVDGIYKFKNLVVLEIQRCAIMGSISDIFKIANLIKLSLIDVGNVMSIKGIENLKNLQEFYFYGTTNVVDGDLNPLLQNKFLSKISYMHRKHYNLRKIL